METPISMISRTVHRYRDLLSLFGTDLTRLCYGNRWLSLRLTALFDTTTFGMALRTFVRVSVSDRGSMYSPEAIHFAIAVCVGAVALYALVSALVFLGPSKISGEDHFVPPGSAPPPLCRSGAYALCDHPLFYLGLLLFWAISLAQGSYLAFVLAGFLHISALAFLFGTEIPDMQTIYGLSGAKNI